MLPWLQRRCADVPLRNCSLCHVRLFRRISTIILNILPERRNVVKIIVAESSEDGDNDFNDRNWQLCVRCPTYSKYNISHTSISKDMRRLSVYLFKHFVAYST